MCENLPAVVHNLTRRTSPCICKGGHHSISMGGGDGVFVANKLFISTWLGGALKISHFITCFYRTVLEVNNLFIYL